jgi:hypothetical protein
VGVIDDKMDDANEILAEGDDFVALNETCQ